ncbi:MAG TPA: hypothetical protein VMZ27_00740 [Candidatus Saccharimonadales bacterium]|nr:hypothetical protein [Candidatus Saccharimonadales bacterium]
MGFSSAGAASYTTAVHDLNGVIPPEAPYAGTPAGPGPLINLTPSSFNTATSDALSAFAGTLESSFHEIKFGPSLELDLTDRWIVGFGAGYSSLFVNSTLRYSETVTFSDLAFPGGTRDVDINKARWSPGLYAEVRASYRFTQHLSAYLGADIETHKAVRFGDGDHKVKLDLGTTFGAKAGISFGF